ncbi:hypothetical protein QE152_g27845 [Popillia japonica]|uniref:Uncharacterized protein n=1 Tax=Popillia japonica TaxID=7064 RepID=A0AAW1JJZ5_POPJA
MNITKSKRNEIPVEFTDANEINSFFVGAASVALGCVSEIPVEFTDANEINSFFVGAASVALGCVSTNGLSAYYNDNFRLNLPELFEFSQVTDADILQCVHGELSR